MEEVRTEVEAVEVPKSVEETEKRKPGRPRLRPLNEEADVTSEKKLGRPKSEENNKVNVCIYLDKDVHGKGREIAISKGISFSTLIENLINADTTVTEKDTHLKLMWELYNELMGFKKNFDDFETTMRNAIKID